MTYFYSNTQWDDVLYKSVLRTKGGLASAAEFIASVRGKSLNPESLRAKLTGSCGNEMSIPMALILTEWMIANDGEEYARDWMTALSVSNGLEVVATPPAPIDGHANEAEAIGQKIMSLTAKNGGLASAYVRFNEDGKIDKREAGDLYEIFDDIAIMAVRGRRNAKRMAEK